MTMRLAAFGVAFLVVTAAAQSQQPAPASGQQPAATSAQQPDGGRGRGGAARAPRPPRPPSDPGSAVPYDVVANWSIPYHVPGYVWGSITGLFVESPDRILIGVRGRIPVPTPQPAGFAGFFGSFGRNAISAPNREFRNCLLV